MTFRVKLWYLPILTAMVATGCSNDAKTPEAQIAEDAVGVKPDSGSNKTVKVKRDVIVKDERTVTDAHTGEVLKDTVKTTPVTVTEEKSEKTDVKVNVGDSKTSGTTSPPQK